MVKVTSKTVRKKCALYFGAEGVYEITITKKSSTSKGRHRLTVKKLHESKYHTRTAIVTFKDYIYSLHLKV